MKYKRLTAWLLLILAGCGILEEDLSDTTVRIVAPADKVMLSAGPVSFRWQQVHGAAGYEFRVVSPSFDRAGRVVADTVIRVDSLGRGYGCTLSLDEGDYQWSVAAFNGGYVGPAEIRSLQVRNPDVE